MEPIKSEITFDEFCKVDLRVGTILSIDSVPKSSKLLKLIVSFGELGERCILAGLAPLRDQNSQFLGGAQIMVGQQVLAVVNLAPRSMMGIISHGMLLACRAEDGTFKLFGPSGLVPSGSEVH